MQPGSHDGARAQRHRATQDQATVTLTDAGLTAVPTTTSNCTSADNGNVVTQDPAAGASAGKGVAEDLCALGGRFPDNALEPVGEATVQLGAKGLGDRPVGRLLDEDVAEAVLLRRASAGRLVLHEPFRDEGLEVAAERAARLGREQFSHFLQSEFLADDGRAGEDNARSRPKPLQACRQQSLDRGRQRRPELAPGLLADRDRKLLEVERIAGRGVKDPCSDGRRDALIFYECVQERGSRAFGERRELDGDCRCCPGRPDRTLLAIEALPRRQRVVLVELLTREGQSYLDLSHRIGLPVGSVGPTRQRAFTRLRNDPRLAGLS